MNIRILLSLFLLAATLQSESAPRPNILYFYVDDMGWGSIGPNGQGERKAKGLPYVKTPNIDALAAKGINFTRGYGCHVCSPARSSQQTGFHQGHTFADRNDPDNAKKAIRKDDVTMGDALAGAGYTTGYWGKWGYGGSRDMNNPTIDNVQTLPTSHGYQFALTELHHVRAHTFFQPTLWSAPAAEGSKGGLELIPNTMVPFRGNDHYPVKPSNHDHPDYPDTAYCDDTYAFAALDFVRSNALTYQKDGTPFFGLLAVQIPHAPFDEISKLPLWDEAYQNDEHFLKLPDQARQWAAMVTRIDAHFGNILSALEDPNGDGDRTDSVADNTLVIFQSDNGGPGGPNNSVFDANGGLRGNKGNIQEGGIRVPLVMRWPAKIHATSSLKAGTNSDRIVDVTDLLPTFCELAGTPTPLGIDGVSIAPFLSGEGFQRKREFIIHEAGNGKSIIRDNYKLVHQSGQTNRKKKTQAPEPFVLYDLEADHSEEHNIAGEHPELVEELKTILLGERVEEPKGFANTYHEWTGENGASAADPANWSDYTYSNAGITYMMDNGTPQLSWIARAINNGSARRSVKVDADLEVLGLEVGGKSEKATQHLTLESGVNLTGRNEIRISNHGHLTLNGGSVSSLRWIDIAEHAKIKGHGTLNATLYNRGNVSLEGGKKPGLRINGDFIQSEQGSIDLSVKKNGKPQLSIDGTAQVGGTLNLRAIEGFQTAPAKVFLLLSAKKVSGKFSNPDGRVSTPDGTAFDIHYDKISVYLKAR